MIRGLGLVVSAIWALGLLSLSRPGLLAQTSSPEPPAVAAPVAVTLDPATTAFLALDFQSTNCTETGRPTCIASLPILNSAMAAARASGVPIIYSYTTGGTIRPEVAPAANDTVLETSGADKFNRTNLDDILKGLGVTTLVITGTASNGAVLYTGLESEIRGYTVVVPVDLMSASSPFPDYFTEWALLNSRGAGSNADNTPLKSKSVTLTRSEMISYGGGSSADRGSALATQPIPSIPAPTAVALDSGTTAFLALDFTSSLCNRDATYRAMCDSVLPAVAAGVTAARAANVPVIYTTFANASLVPDVLAAPNDPVLVSFNGDKFFNTGLDDLLKSMGITTVVVTGIVTDGAALLTSFEAAARGYTVVLDRDGVGSTSAFADQATIWQLMNGAGTGNAQNTPLMPRVVTLSRSDLITFSKK
jgi:nicotinamidase-related amidase